MSKFFAPNLETRGRIVRGVAAILLLLGALYALTEAWWLGLILLVCGGFTLFEAVRGWCVVRACGVKTRL
ncbi:MAG: DUF2892 domain-containing protein [Verrucomicrobia bacterium]|jgi:hypothetical protein|nr:DUF2892 domain-containing protein [Verrucomicrobiota bacterium]